MNERTIRTMNNKITIIGGGVAGASTAIKLADKLDSSSITLIDKNHHFGKACSGILTFAVDDSIKIPNEVIVSKIKNFRIIAPNGEKLELSFKRPDIVCEREKLNEHLNNLVQDKGVNIIRPAELKQIDNKSVVIKRGTETSAIKTTHLIGADGSRSTVANLSGIFDSRNFFVGAKAIVEQEHDDTIEVYPNIGCFAWSVPHGPEHVEVGTISYPNQGAVFDNFLKRFEGKIISKEGALIPLHNPFVKTFTEFKGIKTYLVGDAATMVKATTGGSIIQSFIASQCLVDSIVEDKNYGFEWRKKLGIELFTHLRVRKVLDKLSEKDWNNLINSFQDVKIKNLLETKTRDYPTALVLRTLLNKPSLLKFGLKMF